LAQGLKLSMPLQLATGLFPTRLAMSRACFNIYMSGEESSDSDEAEWDEAARLSDKQASRGANARGLCDQCCRPLRHMARLPACAALLKCGTQRECGRCEEQILPGEMHFSCRHCNTYVCKACGPGVYITRSYDLFDASCGESKEQLVPSRAMHERKARSKLSGQTRSVSLEPQGAESLAKLIVENAEQICDGLIEQSDCSDQDWDDTNLLPRLLGLPGWAGVAVCLQLLAGAVRDVVSRQPVLSEVRQLPCRVYGDIHGQFRDMLLLFHAFGWPGTPDCPRAVFNGDFVDRGKHQLEVVCVLFALKLLHPAYVFLNRGNHEDHHMNQRYGFVKSCDILGVTDGPATYKEISLAFQYLPLAAMITGRILVLHGGIGDGKWTVNDLCRVRRPLSHDDLQKPEHKWIWNILWSDPIEDDTVGTNVFGVHSSPRSRLAVKFGWNVTQAFCASNGIDLVVRSHQSKREGIGFDVMHHESLIRVFSARDYEKNCNDGAVLWVDYAEDDSDLLVVRPQVLGALSR